MKKDRKAICDIISNMLDNPGKCEIYHTSTAYTQLEMYIESARMETLGWAHADACIALDRNSDPRLQEVPEVLERYRKDIDQPLP